MKTFRWFFCLIRHYRRAKIEALASRAAFKLQQIDDKHHFLRFNSYFFLTFPSFQISLSSFIYVLLLLLLLLLFTILILLLKEREVSL